MLLIYSLDLYDSCSSSITESYKSMRTPKSMSKKPLLPAATSMPVVPYPMPSLVDT